MSTNGGITGTLGAKTKTIAGDFCRGPIKALIQVKLLFDWSLDPDVLTGGGSRGTEPFGNRLGRAAE